MSVVSIDPTSSKSDYCASEKSQSKKNKKRTSYLVGAGIVVFILFVVYFVGRGDSEVKETAVELQQTNYPTQGTTKPTMKPTMKPTIEPTMKPTIFDRTDSLVEISTADPIKQKARKQSKKITSQKIDNQKFTTSVKSKNSSESVETSKAETTVLSTIMIKTTNSTEKPVPKTSTEPVRKTQPAVKVLETTKTVITTESVTAESGEMPQVTTAETEATSTTTVEPLPTNAPTTEKNTTTQKLTTTTNENVAISVKTTTLGPIEPLKSNFSSNSDKFHEFVQEPAVLEITESGTTEGSGLIEESPVTTSEPEALTTTTMEPLRTEAPKTTNPTSTQEITTSLEEIVDKSVTTTESSSWGIWGILGKKQAETVSEITESDVSSVTTAEPATTTTTTVKPTNAPTTKKPWWDLGKK